ncbi:hypothetical protein [Nocardioides zeae]
MGIIDKLLRAGEGKIIRQLEAIASAVNAIEDDYVAMSDEELQGQTAEFKKRLEEGRPSTTCCRRRSPSSARPPTASSASGTTTSRSWAAPRCTWATSPR